MSNKLIYLFMRGFLRFLHEFRLNAMTLIMLAALFFVYHIFYVSGTGVASFLSHIAETNTIRVYLKTGIKTSPEVLVATVQKIDGVKSVRYITPKEAKEFVQANAPTVVGVKNFSEEFFPAFLEVLPDDSSGKKQMDAVASKINMPEVQSVSYGKEYISKFMQISGGAWVFLIFISILFGVCISFVIYNTVRLSLYRYRDEIRLYALVGATRPFIAVPYIFEALLNAVFAYVVAAAVFWVTFTIFNEKVLHGTGINIFLLPQFSYFLFVLIFACGTAMFSSAVSVISFLKQNSAVSND